MALGCSKPLSDWLKIAFSSLNPLKDKGKKYQLCLYATLIKVTFFTLSRPRCLGCKYYKGRRCTKGLITPLSLFCGIEAWLIKFISGCKQICETALRPVVAAGLVECDGTTEDVPQCGVK